MVWRKKLPFGKVALLLVNNDNKTQDVSVTWRQVNISCGDACHVHDVYSHKYLPPASDGYSAKALRAHDSRCLIVAPVQAVSFV